MRRILFVLLIPISLAAQVTSTDRTVTVTASRAATVAPDQAVVVVNVYTPFASTRDDVLAALEGSAITVANFTSVYTTSTYNTTTRVNQDQLNWTFTLNVPFAGIKTTIDQLSGLQLAVGKSNKGMQISFGLQGTQTSAQALAGQNCAAADLISDARTQAQKLAAAAGLSVGAVVGVAGTSVVTPPTGGFSSGTYQPSCTLTVKFALTGL
jgi:uncharacterized protein YggE